MKPALWLSGLVGFVLFAIYLFPPEAGWMPHRHCYLWRQNPDVWLSHIVGDALYGISYYCISAALLWVTFSNSTHSKIVESMRGIFFGFAAFIALCGTSHFVAIVTSFYPAYKVEGLFKVVGGLFSTYIGVQIFQHRKTLLRIIRGREQ